jgi:hypothetical protein
MAIVIHTIHGKKYSYDHHRVNGRVVSTYLGRTDDIRTQHSISSKGYPVSSPNYPEAHRKADKEELKEYGTKRWDEVERIAESLPEQELAGSHNGKLIVSKKVPKELRGQVLYHEMKEKELMEGRGAKRTQHQIANSKFKIVMKEYDKGELVSSSGQKVVDKKQAVAIAFNEARKVDPEY